MNDRVPYLRYFPPLLAALIPWRGRRSLTLGIDAVARLVDQGYFQSVTVVDDIFDALRLPYGGSLRRLGCDLVPQLFGRASCPLAQLAARVVFATVFGGGGGGGDSENVPSSSPSSRFCVNEEIKSTSDVTPVHLRRLVEQLCLPVDVLTRFLVVLFRDAIRRTLDEFDWNDDLIGKFYDSDSSDGSTDDDDDDDDD